MTTQSIVAIVHCETYHPMVVETALLDGLELLGGAEHFFNPGEKILLKPNILAPRPAEQAVTTHPSILLSLARIARHFGARVSYGDSPGKSTPANAAEKSGLAEVARNNNIPLADFNEGTTTSFPEGHLVKQFTIANGVMAADAIISLPKMKSHGLTRITGAVKNQFGCIPGFLKAEFHLKFPDNSHFSQMLVDLNRLLKPRLFIMDGIIAMEGNGPGAGTPIPMNVLLLSTDPVALDATFCRLVGVKPETVPTIEWGEKLGLGNASAEHIHLAGAPVDGLKNPNFDVNRGILSMGRIQRFQWVKNYIVPKPVIDAEKCTRCGTCVQVCPANPKALSFSKNKRKEPPKYDYDKCIRCYCCQELCPDNAISLHTPLLGRLIRRN